MKLTKIVIIAFMAFMSYISAQAITFNEFIAKCEAISNITPIKLSSNDVPKLKEEKVDEIIVFKIDSISIDTKQQLISEIGTISKTEDMLAITHNEDETAVQVFIQPLGEKVEMLVTVFDDKDGVIVYMNGSSELLQQNNIVNIGGKDIIKDALKDKNKEQ